MQETEDVSNQTVLINSRNAFYFVVEEGETSNCAITN